MRKVLKIVMAFVVVAFLGACSNISAENMGLKRTGAETTDPKWDSFEDVQISFEDLKSRIEEGQTITVPDLINRGFGPGVENVIEVGYLELEKILIGEKGDRSRLPDSFKACTDKKDMCYGLIAQISSLQTEGQESLFKRMFSGQKKTVAKGWKFGVAFAVERDKPDDRVVAAYRREANSNVFTKKDEDDAPGAVINVLNPLTKATSLMGF